MNRLKIKFLDADYYIKTDADEDYVRKIALYLEQKVKEISATLQFSAYTVDSVTLLTGNAVFKKRSIKGTWHLKEKE